MIALVAATALLVLAIVAVIGFGVQRQFRGPPMQDREAHHAAPQPSDSNEPE
jgi:hypothetical protein